MMKNYEKTVSLWGWTKETWLKVQYFSHEQSKVFRLHEISIFEKCPYSKLFWSAFSRIWTEYGEIRSISPYSVRMRKNGDHNNSKYGHFSRSDSGINIVFYPWYCQKLNSELEDLSKLLFQFQILQLSFF